MIRLSSFFMSLVVLLVGLANVAVGQIVLPTTPNPALPVTITLTPHQGISNCVLPMRVTVNPNIPLTENEQLQLRVGLYTESSKRSQLECRFPIEVRSGSVASHSWIYLPMVVEARVITIEILRDGGSISGFQLPTSASLPLNYSMVGGFINDLVVVEGGDPDERFPDLTGLIAARTNVLFDLPRETALNRNEALELAQQLQGQVQQEPGQNIPWVNVTPIRYDRLCDRWPGMTVQSPILIDCSLLKRLNEENPALIQTLREWTLMSGELWIYGDESSVLVDQLFGKTRPIYVSKVSEYEDHSSVLTVDSKTIKKMFQQRLIDAQNLQNIIGMNGPNSVEALAFSNVTVDKQSLFVAVDESKAASHPYFAAATKEDIQRKIKEVDYGLGRVVSIFPNLDQRLNQVPKQDFSFLKHQNRLRFALTPELGGPPVFLFWGLISFFVIGTGPLLYLWLKRQHRLYRIYLWVPIASLLLTLLTFIWTTVKEGFSVRSYISRLTFVDSAHGRVDVSTETMFNPLGSQTFSHDSKKLVVPLLAFDFTEDNEPYPHQPTSGFQSPKKFEQLPARVILEDSGKEQTWSGEILAMREQQPFVTYKPTLSTDKFRCLNGVVTNGLAFDLRDVLICESNEKFWYVASLPAGAQATAKLQSRNAATKLTQTIVNKMPVLISEPFFFQRLKFMGIPYFNTVSASGNRDFLSVAEKILYDWSRTVPPAGCFIGESTSTVDDPLVKSAEIVGGVHLIMGRLQQ